jgi:DNA-binding transcriptional ArsR family regulator
MATTTAEKRKKTRTALADAIAHPLRSKCLTILADRVASPAEIARELRVEVGSVGYHVRSLYEAGLVEEVSNRPVRGAVEHFYRAVVRPHISTEEEAELTPAERDVFAETALSIFAANASDALAAGSLTDRPDHYLTRVPMRVDEQGWRDLGEAYAEMFERVYEIQGESAVRLGRGDDPGIPTISFLSFFEMPPGRRGEVDGR